jgi:hypothetical protein
MALLAVMGRLSVTTNMVHDFHSFQLWFLFMGGLVMQPIGPDKLPILLGFVLSLRLI